MDLAAFHESHGDVKEAARELNTLSTQNPELLSIIRANVDFYWRQKDYRRSVSILTSAASRAQEPFASELRSEASRKAADSGDYSTARQLLDQLLADDPYNGDLLGQKAATFARANDNAGLLQFYTHELEAFGNSSLPKNEKDDRIAALRRGYIPALISTDQINEALDQYEQVLNQFPEDEDLAREATRFAQKHQLANRLTSYYAKATSDSPRDYRWPLLLARIQNALGRYPESLSNYAKAIYVRSDRTDLLQAKEDLETRLLQFKDAIQTSQKLYELSYHDNRYLADQAALYARLDQPSEALRLLRRAYIDVTPKEPSGYVSALRQLTLWHMFTQADLVYRELRPLLDKGSEWAGEAVLLDLQALASLHRPEDAIAVTAEAWKNMPNFKNIGDVGRYDTAIGAALREYLAPEEKSKLASLLSSPAGVAPLNVYSLARAAGLYNVATAALVKNFKGKANDQWANLQRVQSSRLEFEALGHQLESLARVAGQSSSREQIVRAAISAYASSGDAAAQLRVAAAASPKNQLLAPGEYAELFIQSGGNLPARLAALAKRNPAYADAVVQSLLSTRTLPAVSAAIQARGSVLAASWSAAHLALAGLYFLSPVLSIQASFDSLLGPRTVGGQLASLHSSNDAEMLRNDIWFYYAARNGDYLTYLKQPAGSDLLPAYLESAPAASNSYVSLGDTYLELKQAAHALSLYRDALQLSPLRVDIYDRIALVAAESGNRDEAMANWRSAFRILAARVEEGPLPADYWQITTAVIRHATRVRLIQELRPDADALLHAYIRRNGNYNLAPFLEAILKDSPDVSRAEKWVVQLARDTNLDQAIRELLHDSWLQSAQKETLYTVLIERASSEVGRSSGDAANASAEQLLQDQIGYVTYLLAQNKPQLAWQILLKIEPSGRRPPDLVLEAAALTGNLEAQLAEYQAQPANAPPADQILTVVSALSSNNHRDLAQRIREFEYERELDSGVASAAAYFGLAEVRFSQSRVPEALALIKTATVTIGAPFENFPEAVRLLEQTGQAKEAVHYAEQWKTAEPWNSDALLASARLRSDISALDRLRQSNAASYSVRVESADTMRSLNRSLPGTTELALLTRKVITAAEASQPYFVVARLHAAKTVSDVSQRVTLISQAISLDPSLHEPRLDLAEAASAIHHLQLGLSALDSYVSGGPAVSDRLGTVQEKAAEAFMQQNNSVRAIPLFEQALLNIKDQKERERIEKLQAVAQMQSRFLIANSSRQPVITEQITQPLIVKPKLATLPPDGVQ